MVTELLRKQAAAQVENMLLLPSTLSSNMSKQIAIIYDMNIFIYLRALSAAQTKATVA